MMHSTKKRLIIYLVNNVMQLDMHNEEAAQAVLNSFKEFRQNPDAHPNACVSGPNYLIVLRMVTAMVYTSIKIDPTEAWKDDEDE
jgi:hypothetical protein